VGRGWDREEEGQDRGTTTAIKRKKSLNVPRVPKLLAQGQEKKKGRKFGGDRRNSLAPGRAKKTGEKKRGNRSLGPSSDEGPDPSSHKRRGRTGESKIFHGRGLTKGKKRSWGGGGGGELKFASRESDSNGSAISRKERGKEVPMGGYGSERGGQGERQQLGSGLLSRGSLKGEKGENGMLIEAFVVRRWDVAAKTRQREMWASRGGGYFITGSVFNTKRKW